MPPPITVLVVDDSEEIRSMLEAALAGSGHEVLLAADAVAAFETVRRDRPAVVVTDIMLGVTNGLDLITRVRSDLGPPLPAIIAISGFGDLAAESLQRGACAFIPKPFHLGDLIAAVEEAAAGEAPSASATARIADSARCRRAEASAVASRAIERIGPRFAELSHRAGCAVRWLPGYLGFGEAFVALFQGGRLTALHASEGAHIDVDAPVGERYPLVRDVAETSSSIVLSGEHAPSLHGMRGFFAGVPLCVGRLTVGAICVTDGQPRALSADDFEILQSFGRRASAVLAGDESVGSAPLWTSSGFLSEAGFAMVLSALLRRCRAGWEALDVARFVCPRPLQQWLPHLQRTVGRAHVGIAELDGGVYALVSARRDDGLLVERALTAWAAAVGACVGLLTVDNATVGGVDEGDVGRLAELALGRALARRAEGEAHLERFAVGRVAPAAIELGA